MGGPSIPPKGNIHGGPMLQITQKSIYRAKKLTPDVYLPHVESNRVKLGHHRNSFFSFTFFIGTLLQAGPFFTQWNGR